MLFILIFITLVVLMDVNGTVLLSVLGIVTIIVVLGGFTWLPMLTLTLDSLEDGMLVVVDGLDVMLFVVVVVESAVGVVIGVVLDLLCHVGLMVDDWVVVLGNLFVKLFLNWVGLFVDGLNKVCWLMVGVFLLTGNFVVGFLEPALLFPIVLDLVRVFVVFLVTNRPEVE